MRGRKIVLSVFSALALLAGFAKADPVVANASFEAVQIGAPFNTSNPADIPGWTHAGSVGDALMWHVGYSDSGGSITVAGDGNQFVTMGGGFTVPGSGSWSQTVNGFVFGQTYDLNFEMASETNASQSLTAAVTGSSSQVFTAAASPANYWRNWVSKSYVFTAGATSLTIEFSAVNQIDDVGLDNISITQVQTAAPLPPVLAVGLVLLGAIGIRRKLAAIAFS